MSNVIEKWPKLNEAKINLTSFKLGADGLNSTVIIRDFTGQELLTSHNFVIETVLVTVFGVLNSKNAEVEEQIKFAV